MDHTSQPAPESELHNKLKMAIVHDFNNLYVREFTTDWESQRLVRQLELDVMSLERTELAVGKLIAAAVQESGRQMLLKVRDVIYDSETDEFKTSVGTLKDWIDAELDALLGGQNGEGSDG